MEFTSLIKRSGLKFELGRLLGIPVKLHAGMLVVLVMLVVHFLFSGGLAGLGVLAILIVSSLLHELAHALVARRYKVKPRDLWISPIGGHLRFEKMPKDWNKEFFIAMAGPGVNIAIAAVAFAGHALIGLSAATGWLAGLPFTIGMVNLLFAGFNLLPGFPLDGGRIVRAWLARTKPRLAATRLPVLIGRGVAGLLMISAILPWLPSILMLVAGLYVLLFNEIEWRQVKAQAARGESDFDHPEMDGVEVSPAPYDL